MNNNAKYPLCLAKLFIKTVAVTSLMQSRQDGELNVKILRQLLKGILDPTP
jgi:hypothetical protein